jgi:hypothetical protein
VGQAGGFERPIFYRHAAVEPNVTAFTNSFRIYGADMVGKERLQI